MQKCFYFILFKHFLAGDFDGTCPNFSVLERKAYTLYCLHTTNRLLIVPLFSIQKKNDGKKNFSMCQVTNTANFSIDNIMNMISLNMGLETIFVFVIPQLQKCYSCSMTVILLQPIPTVVILLIAFCCPVCCNGFQKEDNFSIPTTWQINSIHTPEKGQIFLLLFIDKDYQKMKLKQCVLILIVLCLLD